MANEAILIHELESPISMTCADGTGIEKGAVLELSDPLTVITANGDADICGGIAAAEKIANDGKTKIPVYLRGVFKMRCEGAITVGQAVQTAVATATVANAVMVAAVTSVGAKVLGTALETGADGETILVLVNIGMNGMAIS